MATTTFNVSAAYDKAAYNAGEVMTLTLSGNAVFTDTAVTQSQSGSLDQTITASNGQTTHLTAPSVTITTTAPVSNALTVALTAVADTSGRVWTIQPGGMSAKATA
jgi:hypothetical protein